MTLFRNKYRIASARLKNWNYANAGAYCITICTKGRAYFFGKIVNDEMQLSEIGKLVQKYWMEIPYHFKNVRLGEFVIMPNHIHGILILYDTTVETLHCNVSENTNGSQNKNVSQNNQTQKQTVQNDGMDKQALQNDLDNQTLHCNVSTDTYELMSNISPKAGAVTTIIRSFKSVCTKHIRLEKGISDFAWQPRFHDHIIRNHDEYLRIENYIFNNPKSWKEDTFCKQLST